MTELLRYSQTPDVTAAAPAHDDAGPVWTVPDGSGLPPEEQPRNREFLWTVLAVVTVLVLIGVAIVLIGSSAGAAGDCGGG